MNSGERWLRSTLLEEAEFGKGNNANSVGAMIVDSVIRPYLGDHVPKIKESSINARFVGFNIEGSSLLLNMGHLRIQNKSTFGITNDSNRSKEFEEDQEAGIIVNDLK